MNEASDAYKVLAVSYVKPNRKSPFLSLRRGALTYDLVSCQEYFFFGPPPKPILFWLFGVAFFVYFFVVVTFVGVSRSVKKTTTPSGIGKRECCHFLGDLKSIVKGGYLTLLWEKLVPSVTIFLQVILLPLHQLKIMGTELAVY